MDHELVARVQRGDEQAFESLTRADFPRLYRVARGVLGDPHLAEDATQQAFVEIWRDIPRLRDPARYEGWSYRLLVRVCCAEARRRPDGETSVESGAIQPLSVDAYAAVADRDQLERGLRRLSRSRWHRPPPRLAEPRVLLLDEPTLGVDARQAQDLPADPAAGR